MVSKKSPLLKSTNRPLHIYRCAFLGLALISLFLLVFNYSSLNNNAVNVLSRFDSVDVTGYRAGSQFEKREDGTIALSCAVQKAIPGERCGLRFNFFKPGAREPFPSFSGLDNINALILVSRNGEPADNRVSVTFRSLLKDTAYRPDDISTTRYDSVYVTPNTPHIIDRARIVLDRWWDKRFQLPQDQGASDLSRVAGLSVHLENSDALLAGKYTVTLERLVLNQHIVAPACVNLVLALIWPSAMLTFLIHYLFMKRAEVQHLIELTDTDAETGLMNLNGLRRLYPGKLKTPVTVINIRVRNFHSLQKEFSRETACRLIQAIFQPFTGEKGARLLMVKKQDENMLLIAGDRDESLFGQLISASQRGIQMESLGHLRLDVKVGIARGKVGSTMEELLAQSTIAIDAINDGDTSYKLYHPDLRKAWRQARFIEQELRVALKQKAFHLAFMPVYDAVDKRISGAEALLRTSHLPLKSFSPEVYVRVAEEAGLIREIDLWVLEEALKALQSLDRENFVMAINISSRELMDTHFAVELGELIQQYRIRPSQLCLEVTETFFLDVDGICFESIQAIRNLGVRLSLDDFGTGHASLQHLLNMPIDEIKIDRSFVWTLENEKSAVIVDAIVSIAGICRYHVIAEGIETDAQLNKLAALGCRYFQGYLIAKPDSFEKLVKICCEVKHSDRLVTHVKRRA